MSIPTVYVEGSKKQANDYLAANCADTIWGYQFDLSGSRLVSLHDMPDGTVIKFYDKMVNGSPYAKAYGNWRPAKNKIV